MARPERARIVRARRGDATVLAALDERCFPEADRFPVRVWRHLLGPAARRGSAVTLIARGRDGALAAAAGLMRANSRVLRVYTIAVAPEARGQGLGERLLRALAAAAPRRCDAVSLEVRADNPARSLYERLGMRVVERLPRYYDDGAAGVRYRCARDDLARRPGRAVRRRRR